MFNFNWRVVRTGLVLGTLGFLLMMLNRYLLQNSALASLSLNWFAWYNIIVDLLLTAPLLEEICFRMPSLLIAYVHEYKRNCLLWFWFTNIILSFIWSSAHGRGLGFTVIAFTTGILYGWTNFKNKSLFPGLIAHAFHNFLVLAHAIIVVHFFSPPPIPV